MNESIQQAFRDWNESRAYIDNGGNYRVRPEAATPTHRPRGKVAPWNKEVKRLFSSCAEFHAAAQASKRSMRMKPARAITIYDLFAAGWTAHPASLFDEEGVEGWRWEDAKGNERSTVIGNWNELPPLPDCELPSDRNEENR